MRILEQSKKYEKFDENHGKPMDTIEQSTKTMEK